MVEVNQRLNSHNMVLEDIHRASSSRQIALNLVGVNDIRYPMTVVDRDGSSQQTIGTMSLGVDLAKEDKGAHMSRFVEVISERQESMNMASMPGIE